MTLKEFKYLLDKHFNDDDKIYFTATSGTVMIGDINHGTYYLSFEKFDKWLLNDDLMSELKERKDNEI